VPELLAVVVADVAHDQGRGLEPGDAAQRVQVRADREIAVAELPGRRLEAGHRLHLHVEREQVVAGVHLVHAVFDEEVPGHALAHEPALHVREADQHRIDLASFDQARERLQIQHSLHRVPLL
jgi:hypothetical protein